MQNICLLNFIKSFHRGLVYLLHLLPLIIKTCSTRATILSRFPILKIGNKTKPEEEYYFLSKIVLKIGNTRLITYLNTLEKIYTDAEVKNTLTFVLIWS